MPVYVYQARDNLGKSVKGKMETPDRAELARKLRAMGYLVTGIREEGLGMGRPSFLSRFTRVSSRSMLLFNVQLSALLNAGVTLIRSLNILSRQTEDRALRATVGELIRDVEGGSSLSVAMQKHPRLFSNTFVSMVRSGETGGELPEILTRLSKYAEEQTALRQKIQNALMYPVILTVLALVIVVLVVTYVIPQFVTIFAQGGMPIPLPTMVLYRLGIVIKGYWYALLAGIVAICAGARLYARSPRGRLNLDRLTLALPIVGELTRKAAIARFTRTMGMLVTTGVPVTQALDIAEATLGNAVLRGALKAVSQSVREGKGLAEPLRLSGQFPVLTVQMVATGEETGDLHTLLDKVADYYELEVDYAIKRFTVLIEPFFLVVMGSVIGFIMASIMIPLFRMVNVVSVH
ncbi:MAG: type II secretion system F family protein [Chlamydiota bacterium]